MAFHRCAYLFPLRYALVPHSMLQNRYFPMTFQAWMIGSQCLTSLHELEGVLTISRAKLVVYSPVSSLGTKVSSLQTGTTPNSCSRWGYGSRCVLGVRVKTCTSQMLPHVPRCRCERTAWYTLFAWTICALLARVAVTVRSVPFLLFDDSGSIPSDDIPGYTPCHSRISPASPGWQSSPLSSSHLGWP